MRKPYVPALVLLILAPALPELLSGNMPPVKFFHPLALATLIVLYGGGAVLIREMIVHWGKGWPTLLALGAAYGILEEGLLCKSFFDPQWQGLNNLATYGRWLGVNWVWSLNLTIFHALFSIAATICVVELIFPAQRGRPWVRSWVLVLLLILLVLDVLLGYLAFGGMMEQGGGPYRPPTAPYLVALALVLALVLLGRRLPKPAPPVPAPTSAAPGEAAGEAGPRGARPLWFFLVGFFGTVLFFVISWVVPNLNVRGLCPHPVVNMAVMAAYTCFGVWLVWRMSGRGAAWSDSRAVALASGSVWVFVSLLGPVLLLNKDNPKNMAGMWIVDLVAAALLVLLAWRVRRRRLASEALAAVSAGSVEDPRASR